MNDWRKTIVAPDQTHHLLDGQPLYGARFLKVQKFHEPGLAPARDNTGAFHINTQGEPVYASRFLQTFGFYEGVAAVENADGWHHIRSDGTPLYAERYGWCGNMQGGRVVVRTIDGSYLHLTTEGIHAYAERHRYAGDYRDGIACARFADGWARHIDLAGHPVHGGRFLDLDVYHKGFARARDEGGWLHIDRIGQPAYAARFAAVEPFYNGQAYSETLDGRRVVIAEDGGIIREIWTSPPRLHANGQYQPLILVIGNVGSGKSTIRAGLAKALGWKRAGIDDARRAHSDGTPAGEAAAWTVFLRSLQSGEPLVAEFSGSGHLASLVSLAVKPRPFRVLFLNASNACCRARIAGRTDRPPYPDFGVSLESLVTELGERIVRELQEERYWRRSETVLVDANAPQEMVMATALTATRKWLDRLEVNSETRRTTASNR
jgi:adenylate kinase family enzyme